MSSYCAIHSDQKALGLCMRCGDFACAHCLLAPKDSPCLTCRTFDFQEIFHEKKRKARWLLALRIVAFPVGAILLSTFYGVIVSFSFSQQFVLHYTILAIAVMGIVGSLFKYFHNLWTWSKQYRAAIVKVGDIQSSYSKLSESQRAKAGQEYLEMAYLEVHSIGLPNTESSFRLEI